MYTQLEFDNYKDMILENLPTGDDMEDLADEIRATANKADLHTKACTLPRAKVLEMSVAMGAQLTDAETQRSTSSSLLDKMAARRLIPSAA